jgi:hypothetical protein
MKVFDVFFRKTEEDLKADTEFWSKHGSFIEANPRGYGYYIWKPYIIMKALEQMNDNDILVFADAGCSFNHHAIDRLKEYFKMVQDDEKGILTFKLKYLNKHWTKMDTFIALDTPEEHRQTNQRISGAVIIRKCNISYNIIREWYTLMENYHYIDDKPSIAPNYPHFFENRHDQSIYALLALKYDLLTIRNEVDDYDITTPIWGTRLRHKPNDYPVMVRR